MMVYPLMANENVERESISQHYMSWFTTLQSIGARLASSCGSLIKVELFNQWLNQMLQCVVHAGASGSDNQGTHRGRSKGPVLGTLAGSSRE